MNVKSHRQHRSIVAATLGVVALSSGQSTLAASGVWSPTPTDANWGNAANWVPAAVPGATTGNTNDVATFNTALATGLLGPGTLGGATDPILPDLNRRIGSILFDTANVGSYQIGVNGGNALSLTATAAANSTTISSAVTASQVIAAPLTFNQTGGASLNYAFNNNAANSNVTLSLTGTVNPSNTTRFYGIILGGSNTGDNIISGNITYTVTTGVGSGSAVSGFTKTGAGKWILSGNNTFAANNNVLFNTVAGGFQINQGTLSARNNNALGQVAGATDQPNELQASVNNGGTLELANGITLNNVVGVNLNNGGTISSSGTNAMDGRVNVSTAAATSVTLSTVGSSDVFTIGNAANEITGGLADSVIKIAGPGTVAHNFASNYAGGYSINAGALRIGNATALGAATTANVVYGAGSTGVLQLNGVSATVIGLQGTSSTTAVENFSGSNTLTVNNANANQYGGTLRDGAGQLSLTKSGAGVLALTGASTLTGAVNVTNGQLLANNTTGSATGTDNTVTASGNAVIGGSGTIASAVNLSANAHLAPGATAGQVGTLHVGSLTLGTGTNLDYDITSTAVLDQTIVDTSGGLTINGGTLNINGGGSALTVNGVYNLIGYTGSIGGTGTSALAINAANTSPATNSYIFGTAGGYVTLTIASTGATIDYWNADADGNWSTGPWTPAEPNGAGAFASFGGGGVPITQDRTITVDAPKTVGTVAFNNANGKSYTIAGANAITLNNNANPAFITDAAGSHTISAPLALATTGNTVTVTGAGDTLTVSGTVTGTGSVVTKLGAGTLAMTGVNTYDGGTNLNGGTIAINSADSLGAITGNLDFAGGTLQTNADVTTTRTYTANANDADVKINTNGFNLTQNGNILASVGALGGLVKTGGGTLTLAGNNTYVGATTVTGGTLSISSNANLGDGSQGGALNLSGGATLRTTGNLSLDTNRPVNIGTGNASFAPDAGTTVTVPGTFTSSQPLNYNGPGTLLLAGNNALTFTGNVTLNNGVLALGGGNSTANNNNNNALGSGTVTFQGGRLNLNGFNVIDSGATSNINNNLVVATGQTGTLGTGARSTFGGTLTGGGTLNYEATGIRGQINGNWAGFAGTINFTAEPGVNGGTGDVRFNTTAGFPNAKVSLGAGVNFFTVVNFGQPANTTTGQVIPIGELSGTGGNLSGGTVGGRISQYVIGALNTDSTYAGVFTNATGQVAVTKVGTGKLTLTGASSHSGTTTISAGTLNINGINALGGANYGAATGAQTGGIANAGLYFNGGTLQYASPANGGLTSSGDITVDATGANIRNVFFGQTAVIDTNGNDVSYANPVGNAGTGGLTKIGAGTLTLNGANTYTGTTTVITGAIKANSNAYTPILANTTSGADLQGGRLLLDYGNGNPSPVAQIKTLLDNEYATNGGNFTAGQVRSTTAAANGKTLGYGDDALGTVTILYTLSGDADLNGQVNFNDFLVLQNFFSQAGTRFDQGNFNYDGQTDFNDFLALQNNFGQSVTGSPVNVTAAQVAALTAFANSPASLVPEPATLAVVGLGGLLLGRRRRRA